VTYGRTKAASLQEGTPNEQRNKTRYLSGKTPEDQKNAWRFAKVRKFGMLEKKGKKEKRPTSRGNIETLKRSSWYENCGQN